MIPEIKCVSNESDFEIFNMNSDNFKYWDFFYKFYFRDQDFSEIFFEGEL
jgi:hypothetical protein